MVTMMDKIVTMEYGNSTLEDLENFRIAFKKYLDADEENQYYISLLSKSPEHDVADQMEFAWKEADIIVEKMDQLGARIEVEDIKISPQVITYYCVAAEKVRVKEVSKFSDDLQYELGSQSISISAPQPGSKFITISVPNTSRRVVLLGDVIESAESPLTVPLGIDIENQIVAVPINEMPHMLVAGTTGAGKSVCLSSIVTSLLMATTPADLLFMMVDTKQVEMTAFENIPNLLCPVITDAYEAIDNFEALVAIMESRYALAKEYNCKTLDELNSKLPYSDRKPYILVICDEIADLMYLSKHKIEESIIRIAQKARAVGIHLILATQSPRRDIITGLLKANLSSRIGFATTSGLDSRIIMDKMGCENLLGDGDLLYSHQGKAPIRIQGAYVSPGEISAVVNRCRNQSSTLEMVAA